MKIDPTLNGAASRPSPRAVGTSPTNHPAEDPGADGSPALDVRKLFDAESARLRSAVRRRIGDADEAADIVQDAFARLLQAKPRQALRAPAAYLHRIVRNLIQDRAKRVENRFLLRGVCLTEEEMPSMPPEQEWGLEAADLRRRYELAVASLSARTREVFLLHRVDELRYQDIATRLSISVATVEYHMMRALTQLDEALA